jgi:hypothetical protein
MPRINGVVTALVTDVADPDAQGRIKLRFPWLAEEGADSGWAPIAAPMAGRDRGYYYLPEVDDEALVAFEHGDIDHPFVLGFLHNGVDLPPYHDIDEHVRRVKSVAGHILEFDDRSGRESVRLKSNSGHQLELHDQDGYAELHTAAGQKIRLEDQPGRITLSTVAGTTITLDDVPGKITLTTAGGTSVTIDDVPGEVAVQTSSGTSITAGVSGLTVQSPSTVTINASTVDVNAAMVAVSSGMATFSGVVQCSTLIAQSVVSASYTPGAGNIW